MSDSHFVDCANCGQQTMVDLGRPGDACQFCGKDARKKEVIMAEKEAAVGAVQNYNREPAPTKPKDKRTIGGYWEKNREAMTADYQSMRVSSFISKWGLSSTTWQELKNKWGVPNKIRGRAKATKSSIPEPSEQATDAALTEHERYLILLGYQQATREFLKILLNKP